MKLRDVFSLRDPMSRLLTGAIVVLGAVVAVLLYSFLSRTLLSPPVDATRTGEPGSPVIQVDVLNGCGIAGAASSATTYLRARGFDVVEVRNFKTFDVETSMVVNRRGNADYARRVAYALGIARRNIVEQLNEDYFVDVSVVIGRDFASLKPSQEGEAR